jgi:hypothetical protein
MLTFILVSLTPLVDVEYAFALATPMGKAGMLGRSGMFLRFRVMLVLLLPVVLLRVFRLVELPFAKLFPIPVIGDGSSNTRLTLLAHGLSLDMAAFSVGL